MEILKFIALLILALFIIGLFVERDNPTVNDGRITAIVAALLGFVAAMCWF